jgi:hypothetical protein
MILVRFYKFMILIVLMSLSMIVSAQDLPSGWEFDDNHTDLTKNERAYRNLKQDILITIVGYDAKLDIKTEELAKKLAFKMQCPAIISRGTLGFTFWCKDNYKVSVIEKDNGYDIVSINCKKEQCVDAEKFVLWLDSTE